MAINDEIKDLFNMIYAHPDEIDKLNLFIRLKNGTIFNYKIDRKKEAQIMLSNQARQQKIEEKQHKIEEKRQKLEQRKKKQ